MFIEIGVNTIILICFHEMLTKAFGFQWFSNSLELWSSELSKDKCSHFNHNQCICLFMGIKQSLL